MGVELGNLKKDDLAHYVKQSCQAYGYLVPFEQEEDEDEQQDI